MADLVQLARERALRVAELSGDEEAAERLRLALNPDDGLVDLGGGWYQAGEEKVQGRDAARALLDEEEE